MKRKERKKESGKGNDKESESKMLLSYIFENMKRKGEKAYVYVSFVCFAKCDKMKETYVLFLYPNKVKKAIKIYGYSSNFQALKSQQLCENFCLLGFSLHFCPNWMERKCGH